MNAPLDDEALREMLDRARRTETKVTKIAEHIGVDSGVTRPVFKHGRLYVTSRKTTLDDVIGAIPSNQRDQEVDVMCGDDLLMVVVLDI